MRDLRLSYLIGIGVETAQVKNLLLDFLNLYLVSMYVLNNRNPILIKIVKKIFWSFPSKYEDKEKWNRLDPIVKQQVAWLYDPSPLIAEHANMHKSSEFNKSFSAYKSFIGNMKESEKQRAQDQFHFALEYNKNPHMDLN